MDFRDGALDGKELGFSEFVGGLPGKTKTAMAILGWRVASGGFGAGIDGLMGGF